MSYRYYHEDAYDDDQPYEDPPLYPAGHLRGLSQTALELELSRQCRIHDAAVDRCEEINSPTIETAQARINFVQAEMRYRQVENERLLQAWENEGGRAAS